MKISFENLKKTNTVFIFVFSVLISLFIIGALVYAGVDFLSIRFYRAPGRGVDIIENTENIDAGKLVYFTQFMGAVKDTYIFAKTGSVVLSAYSGVLKNTKSYDYASDEILNLYFVSNKTKQGKPLFEDDTMIVFHRFARSKDDDKDKLFISLSKNIYVAVLKDTDADKKLTFKDDTALYVSEYNGSGLKKLSDNIFSCEFVRDDEILFCEYKDNRCVYHIYDMINDRVETVFYTAGAEPEKRFGSSYFYQTYR